MNKLDNPIVKMTLDYALQPIDLTEKLKSQKHFELANQLFRSVTSIGANTWESQNAESRKDFIHKLKIAAKETDETQYWLLLCQSSQHLPSPKQEQFTKLKDIEKVLSKIILTTKSRM